MPTDADSGSTPPPSPYLGRVFGGSYRIVRCIAEGGMASIFEAEHVRLKRPFALKVIAEHLSGNPEAQARFQREAETISRLHHPNIVQVTDFDTTPEGEPYLVMELLQGESLADRLRREVTLGLEQVVLIVWQVASALADAHGKGIVHRDLTPANVFLTSVPGQPLFVKLLDFGISKAVVGARNITKTFEVVGTVQYMAPEQAVGGAVDTPADQFALACIVYRSLAGKLPFDGKSPMEVLQAVAFQRPEPIGLHRPNLPIAVDEVLATALSKDPAGRFTKISDFAVALTRAADSSVNVTFSTAPPPLVGRGSPLPPLPPLSAGLGELAERMTIPATPHLDVTIRPGAPTATPAAAFEDAVRSAEAMFAKGEPDEAWARCSVAETAFATIVTTEEAERAALRLQALYEAFLGGTHQRVQARLEASMDELTPAQAFLLSRVGEGSTVEELLDLSLSSRRDTLRDLVELSRSGHLSLQ
jgi:serine/threonine protein kinase